LGDAFVDIVAPTGSDALPLWGGDINCAAQILPHAGGSALNTATHFAGSGSTTTFFTALGNDQWADVLKGHCTRFNIALSSTVIEGSNTGVCIVISGLSDRTFVTSYGAAAKFADEHVDWGILERSADHLHIGGLFSIPSIQRKIGERIAKLRLSKEKSSPPQPFSCSLDTNYDSRSETDPEKAWCWDGESNWFLEEILPQIDVFLPNETEAMGLSRTTTVQEAIVFISGRMRPGGLVVVTTGKSGAIARRGAEEFVGTSPTVEVVDTTGAGDAFNAAFISTWLNSGKTDILEALRMGCGAGAVAITQVGACDEAVTLEAVKALLAAQ